LSYNLIAIPIAALGFLKPIVAAISMAFSDIVVIGNSILLRIKKRD
jgi:Cu+-exporting ATPase